MRNAKIVPEVTAEGWERYTSGKYPRYQLVNYVVYLFLVTFLRTGSEFAGPA